MFRQMYKDPKFIGAEASPPNNVTVVTEDGIECYKSEHITFRSEAIIDKQMKLLKGTPRGKDKIRELFLEPMVKQRGRFTVTVYEF
jgi:hypothetical protein|tara:strand:+ start:1770 stop:2027 length:258 start_codon:yes stop_codon:yes gene_type:complete